MAASRRESVVPIDSLLNSFKTDKSTQLTPKTMHDALSEFPARKSYRYIVHAIENCISQATKQGPQLRSTSHTEETDEERYQKVVRELAEILGSNKNKNDQKVDVVQKKDASQKKDVSQRREASLKRADLFHEALQDFVDTNSAGKTEPGYLIVQALCLVDPETAFIEEFKDEGTPFHCAAQAGATQYVEVMIEELLIKFPGLKSQKEPVRSKYLSRQRKKDGKTAFLLAAEQLKEGVLELLLKTFPGLADMKSVNATIRRTASDQKPEDMDQEEAQAQEQALKAFKLILKQMGTVGGDEIWGKIWQEAVNNSSRKVVHHLLHGLLPAQSKMFVTYDNVKFVVEKGSKEIWKEFHVDTLRKLFEEPNKKDLLHTAVKFRNAEIVEEIVREFPEQVEVDIGSRDEPKYPMHFLGKAEQGKTGQHAYDRIRNELLHAMIRSTSDDMGIREIRRILRDSNVEAHTICLHLSNIDTEEQTFAEYVQSLQDQDKTMGKIFKFERILKYANFPDLHIETPKRSEDVAASLREDHNEIKVMFEWLQKRGVKHILELFVPDRLFCPHSDADVAQCVVPSEVRVLKWRKLDLYLGNLTHRKDLQVLYLYSSGNQSVHEQWYRELRHFPNLRELYVKVVADVLSDTRVKEVIKELRRGLKGIIENFSVKEYYWASDTSSRTYRDLAEIKNDFVGPNLAKFITKYHSAPRDDKGVDKTKVALIDSGVVIVGGKPKAQAHAQTAEEKERESDNKTDPAKASVKPEQMDETQWSTNDLAQRVVDGKSFVNTGDDEEQVWWHASEPHGTQMARLICSIDPCCWLYVAKVAETRSSGVSANVVAEAIEWAIDRGVDIISLSLVAYTDTNKMSAAIRKAKSRDIVILSSTSDEGLMNTGAATQKLTHALNNDILTIAACDRWGNLLDRSQKEGYEYRFVGHDVHVGQVPFLKSPESISGSSVATAIAAGTASLVLACCRLSENCKTTHNESNVDHWRCPMVRVIFSGMLEGPEKKYVALETLCGKGNKKLEDFDFKHTVNNTFRS